MADRPLRPRPSLSRRLSAMWYDLTAGLRRWWWSRTVPVPGKARPGRLQAAARFAMLPVSGAITSWKHAGAWWSQRNGRLLTRGLPFLAVAVGCAYFAVAHQVRPADSLRRDYEFSGRQALARKDYAQASLCFERLAELDRDRPSSLFQLALAAEGLQDHARRDLLLNRLSPPDRPVHGAAHYWKAQQVLARSGRTGDHLREAEIQLQHALALEPGHVHAQALLASVLIRQGRLDEAERHLLQAIPSLPDLQLTLARVCAEQGRAAESRQWAKAADELFTLRLAQDTGNHQARLHLAETKLFLGEHAQAVELLRQGLLLSPDPVFRTALSRVYVEWSDTLPLDDPAGRKFQLLESGLEINPNDPALFDRLMRLLSGDRETADEVRKRLLAQLAQGHAPALIHLLLGTDAGQRGNAEQAVLHLKRAHEIDPDMSVIGNNLAWYLAHSDTPDLPGALGLMEAIVQRWPSSPEFRDTRGQILVKLERWDEALRDLEFALPALRDNIELHLALAKVYRHQNLPDLAREHEQIADRLRGGTN